MLNVTYTHIFISKFILALINHKNSLNFGIPNLYIYDIETVLNNPQIPS